MPALQIERTGPERMELSLVWAAARRGFKDQQAAKTRSEIHDVARLNLAGPCFETLCCI